MGSIAILVCTIGGVWCLIAAVGVIVEGAPAKQNTVGIGSGLALSAGVLLAIPFIIILQAAQ